MNMTTMKQAVIRTVGGPDVIKLEDAPRPTPKDNEVLIEVQASGVNYADIMRRRDVYIEKTTLPLVLGAEVAGFVAEVGSKVTRVKKNDRVLAFAGIGGYAEYAVANENFVNPISNELGFAESTAFLIQGLSAYLMLTDAGPSAGKSIVIEGAAGGVGSLMVQFARNIGVKNIIALASTEEKRQHAKNHGAHHTIDTLSENRAEQIKKLTDGKGVDVYFEMGGGEGFFEALKATRQFGTVVTYGNTSNAETSFNPSNLVGTNQSVRGFYVGAYFGPDQLHLAMQATQAMIKMYSESRLKICVQKYPLSKAADAHRDIESRKTTGKVVLESRR
jgi:NADPH2:quinone reductase